MSIGLGVGLGIDVRNYGGSAAPAVPALVQTSGLKNIVASTAGTDTLTASASFTAGNTVILAMTYFNSGSLEIATITAGGTAMVKDVSFQSSVANTYRVEIWRATNVTGGTPNVVFTNPGGTYYVAGSFEEWSGFTASPADQIPVPVFGAGTSNSITSGVTAQAKEVVYAASMEAPSFTTGDGLAGPTSGYTQTALANTTGVIAIAAGYKIVSSTGAQVANFTNNSANETGAVMVTYKTN